jgi:carbon starvation protein
VYSYIASVLPVWILLQPRDFINSLQLLSALALLLVGLVAAAFFGGAPDPAGARAPLEFAAPAVHLDATGPGLPIFPFLFITVACGAISGFHCLVSSGTSSKQLRNETDAQLVGYGSMLTEGFLAVLVILACAAGIGLGITGKGGAPLSGAEAWQSLYAGGFAMKGGEAIRAFVEGSANFIGALGLSREFAVALMGVLVASFAATTMDTACRLHRYVIQELAGTFEGGTFAPVARPLRNKHGATLLSVGLAALIAAFPLEGKAWTYATAGSGGMILWPVFGAINQLLGGLAFTVIAFWMWRRRLPVWFMVVPGILMLFLPAYAMMVQVFFDADGNGRSWIEQGQWLLAGFGIATLLLEFWMVKEAIRIWPQARGILESNPATLDASEAAS